MMQLTDEQLNNLNKKALAIIASSMQSQFVLKEKVDAYFEWQN